MDRRASLLRDVDLFDELRSGQLEALAASTRFKYHKRGALVVEAGEPGHSMYIVASGTVVLRRAESDGQHAILDTLGPGDHFGELSLLDGFPWPVDAVCLEASEFLVIDRGDLARCIEANSSLALKVMATLCKRLRAATGAMVSHRPVRERLALLILEAARKSSTRTAQGHLRFRLQYSRQLLAAAVQARRETVSRELRKLAESGALAVRGRELLVDEKRLAEIAGGGSV